MSQTEVVNDSLIARETYRRMLLIRRFEERVIQLVNANEIAGTTHEYIGEEAIAVGVCTMLQQADVITSTHRGHGHIIAKGGDVKRMMAELFGRRTHAGPPTYSLGTGGRPDGHGSFRTLSTRFPGLAHVTELARIPQAHRRRRLP